MSETNKCDYCPKTFATIRGLHIHAHYHLKGKINEKKNFKTKSTVEKITKYSCSLCNQKFVKLKECRLHCKDHNIVKNNPDSNKEQRQPVYSHISPVKATVAISVKNNPDCNKEQHQPMYSHISPVKAAVAMSDSETEVNKVKSPNVAAFQSYKCPNCGENFSKYKTLQKHLCSHLNICDYSCNDCLESYRLEYNLNSHFNNKGIHGKVSYCCTICNKKFNKKVGFQSHKIRHVYKPPFYCPSCGRKFFSYSKRLRHIKHHTNKCAICKVPIHREDYLSHVLKVHGSNIDVSIPDSTSEEEASEDENAMKDLALKSASDILSSDSESERENAIYSPKQNLICFICEQKVPSMEALDNHIKLHKVFRCPTCSKYFICELKFKKHVANHVTKSDQNKNSSQINPPIQSDSEQSNETIEPVHFITTSSTLNNIPSESRVTNDDKSMAIREHSADSIKSSTTSVSQPNSQELEIRSAFSTDDFRFNSNFSKMIELYCDVVKKSKSIVYPISDDLCQNIVNFVTELNSHLNNSNHLLPEKKKTYKQFVDGLKSILIENVHAKCNCIPKLHSDDQ